MALNTPSNLYTFGAERFDSSPSVNFYAKLLAQKQAKEDALDEYYKKLPGTINETGMADNDRNLFSQQMGDLKSYWLKNRDKLKKNDPEATLEYENRYRQARQLVDESKSKAKTSLELGKMRFDPNKAYIFDDPDIIDSVHSHDLPIGDPNRKSLNLSEMVVPPKPFNQKSYIDSFNEIKRDKSTTGITQNPSDLTITTTNKQSFGKSAVDAIGAQALAQYQSDPSFKKFVKKSLDSPEWLKDLNPIYKQYFGKDIESYEDFAKAYTLKSLQPEITEQKITPDTFARQKYMQQLRLGGQKELAAIRYSYQQLNEQGRENRLNAILEGYEDEAKSNPGGEISLNPVILKQLNKKDQYGDDISAQKVKITPEGKVEYTYSDGTTGSLTKQDLKAIMRDQFSQKVNIADVKNVQEPTKPKPTTKKSFSYKGKTYGYDQIEKAAKQSGISVDEYIKKAGLQ